MSAYNPLNCLLFCTDKTRRRQKKCSQRIVSDNLKTIESNDEVKSNDAEGSMDTNEGLDEGIDYLLNF